MPREGGSPWRLADVEGRAAGSRTFAIPSREEREDLWPGDQAKVVFEGIGERLWVRVMDVLDGCVYLGSIVSSPLYSDCRMGERLVFGPEHVADISRKSIPGFDRPLERRRLGTKTLLQ